MEFKKSIRNICQHVNAFNAGTLKCMKETFSKEGIKKNVGSYLFIVIFISECAIFGLYLFNKNQIFRQFLVCHATKLFTSSVEDNNKTLTKTDNSKEGLKIINEKNGLKMLDNLNENITPHKMSSEITYQMYLIQILQFITKLLFLIEKQMVS